MCNLLVAERGHWCASDQSTGVGNSSQRVVAIHDANFRDTEPTSTGLRNTSRDVREGIRAEHCRRAGSSLLNDCEVITALRTAGQNRVDQVDTRESSQVSSIRAVAGRCLVGGLRAVESDVNNDDKDDGALTTCLACI